jgi:hypothetical protein
MQTISARYVMVLSSNHKNAKSAQSFTAGVVLVILKRGSVELPNAKTQNLELHTD